MKGGNGFSALAIDFETANTRMESACAVGIAAVVDGEVVSSRATLIHPPTLDFSPFNVSIHGITPEDVADAPPFPEVWAALLPIMAGRLVLAHNAPFDMGVLRALLRTYELPFPEFSYACTVQMARRCWPGLPNHKLGTVAGYLNIPLNHHDAESDARAAAVIACRAVGLASAAAIVSFAKPFGAQSTSRKTYPKKTHGVAEAVGDKLRGLAFSFTGTLQCYSRDEAAHVVESEGGHWHESPTQNTDFLVVGADPGLGKLQKAAASVKKYGRPQQIGEEKFLAMLSGL